VSGAWYHEHADLTFYVKGHVRVHQEKSFSPTAVLPADPADQSVATLSLVNDQVSNFMYVDDGGYYYVDGAGYYTCPEWFPICEWFQAGVNPLPILGGIVGEIGGVIQSISDFFVGVEATAASDPYPNVASLSETVLLGMEAIAYPSWTNVAAVIFAAEYGGWTGALVEDFIYGMTDWLFGLLMM
jgi:hypothetical protein